MKWNIAVYLEGGEGGGVVAIMTPTPESARMKSQPQWILIFSILE